MENFDVLSDIVSVKPEQVLQVSYPSGVMVDLGNELTPTQVKSQPTVKWDTENGNFYTLCMTDPDVPSHKVPKLEVLHWLVVNIPENDVKSGDLLAEYHGSGPLLGSGLHNYIFLIFKQKGKINVEEGELIKSFREGRTHFSTKKFAEKYDLGHPIAGNFFQAQYDAYVPIIHNVNTH